MVQVREASVEQGFRRSNETFRDGRESCGLRRTDGAFMQNQRAAAERDGRRRLSQRWTEISGIDACEAGGETRLAVACWRLASTPGILRQTICKVLDTYVARGTHGSPACHIAQDGDNVWILLLLELEVQRNYDKAQPSMIDSRP